MPLFRITRVYSDASGETYFSDENIPLLDAGKIGWLSETQPATGIIYRENEPGYNWDFHTAPQRQLVVLLDGQIEIEVSTGEKRTFGAGDIVLLEDTEGKGHRTRHLIPQRRRSLFITLPPPGA